MKKKTYFLDQHKQFVECKILKGNNYKLLIKILEGKKAGKAVITHPRGVAKGWLYPRLFDTDTKPTGYYEFNHRIVLKRKDKHTLTPDGDPGFRFQPFLTHVMDSINANENILLTGGTGVGKTTHIVQLAGKSNQPLVRVNFNGETRLSDFIGKIHVRGGDTKWIDGVLPMAMRKGYWLLLDEIDFADPAILSLLHPVLEEDSCLVLKENAGEVVRPHPDFRIFATANSIGVMQDRAAAYTGTNTMNEAFLDRWQVLFIPNLPEKEEVKVVRSKTSGLRYRWGLKIVEFAQKVRDHKLEGGVDFGSDNFSTRRVLAWAKKTALLGCPIKGAELAWLDKMPGSEQEAIKRVLKLHFGTTRKNAWGKKVAAKDAKIIKIKKKK